jgi:hypothetical protein
LIVLIPRDQNEDIENLPVNVKSYSRDKLGALKAECLEMIALVLGFRTFQISIGRSFADGDLSIVNNDFFSPIVEKLLLLTPENQKGARRSY